MFIIAPIISMAPASEAPFVRACGLRKSGNSLSLSLVRRRLKLEAASSSPSHQACLASAKLAFSTHTMERAPPRKQGTKVHSFSCKSSELLRTGENSANGTGGGEFNHVVVVLAAGSHRLRTVVGKSLWFAYAALVSAAAVVERDLGDNTKRTLSSSIVCGSMMTVPGRRRRPFSSYSPALTDLAAQFAMTVSRRHESFSQTSPPLPPVDLCEPPQRDNQRTARSDIKHDRRLVVIRLLSCRIAQWPIISDKNNKPQHQ
jgi:hypothetical protein